jgi:hypothetical protein
MLDKFKVRAKFRFGPRQRQSPQSLIGHSADRYLQVCPFLNKTGNDKELLLRITWGFLNNRYYGPINPFDNEVNTVKTVFNNSPRPILKINCYKEILFETNPILKYNYEKYKFQID